MPFFRRRNTSRRWLPNLPTLPVTTPIIRPVPQIVATGDPDIPFVPESPTVDDPEFTPYTSYETAARSTTVITTVTTDGNKSPEFRAEQPITFRGFDVPIELRAGEPIAIDLYNYINVDFPSRFYLTMTPDWLELTESILAGNAPEEITINQIVKIQVLVETPSQSVTITFNINLIGSTIIDGTLTRLLDDQGTGLVAEEGVLAPLEANFIDLPTEVVTHEGDIAVGVRFSHVIEGFTERTSAVLINNDGTDIHSNESITGSGNDYVVVFDVPNEKNDAYFIRIPKNTLSRGDEEVPEFNLDSPVFEIDNTGDADDDRVSLIPEDLAIEQEFFRPETFQTESGLSILPPGGITDAPNFSPIDQQLVCVGQPFILNLNSYLDVNDATITLKDVTGSELPPGMSLIDGMVFGTVTMLEDVKYNPIFVAENDDGDDEIEVEFVMVETGQYTPVVSRVSGITTLTGNATDINANSAVWTKICDQIFVMASFDVRVDPDQYNLDTLSFSFTSPGVTLGRGYGVVSSDSSDFNGATAYPERSIFSVFVRRKNGTDGNILNLHVSYQGFFGGA